MIFSHLSTTSVLLMCTVAEAGVYTLPLTRRTYGIYWSGPDLTREAQSHRDQIVLASPSDHSSYFASNKHNTLFKELLQKTHFRHKLDNDWDDDDDENWFLSDYTTPLGVGNPPVNFTAVIDTSWSTLFIPSANCTYDPAEIEQCKRHTLYNSSVSSTYKAHLTPAELHYPASLGGYTQGNVSQDDVRIGGLELKGQLFEEATLWRNLYVVDTALGLSLFPAHSGDRTNDFTTPSLLHSMTKQRQLDENIVSLKLSRSDKEKGEMVLGGLPENLWLENMIVVPLDHSKTSDSNHIWRYYTMGGWQVPIKNMTMAFDDTQNSTLIADRPQIAIVSSSFPWIGVTDEVFQKFHEAIGLDKNTDFAWMDCAKRRDLPNWTIVFGPHGQQITLTPWDYLMEVYDKAWSRWKCVSGFFALGEYGDEDFMILGLPFLNGLYSIWDADRKSISFINRPF